MEHTHIKRLEESFKQLAPRGEELINRLYSKLFADHPELRPIFPDDMDDQKRKFLASLVFIVHGFREPDKLRKPLQDMGARHADFGVRPEHYPIVTETLRSIISEMAGDRWNNQAEKDWTEALDLIASIMLVGAHERETATATA